LAGPRLVIPLHLPGPTRAVRPASHLSFFTARHTRCVVPCRCFAPMTRQRWVWKTPSRTPAGLQRPVLATAGPDALVLGPALRYRVVPALDSKAPWHHHLERTAVTGGCMAQEKIPNARAILELRNKGVEFEAKVYRYGGPGQVALDAVLRRCHEGCGNPGPASAAVVAGGLTPGSWEDPTECQRIPRAGKSHPCGCAVGAGCGCAIMLGTSS